MSFCRHLYSPLLGALFGACNANTPAPYPENCRTTSPTPIAMDDDSVLGFSGADVLAELNSASPGQFQWASGEVTTLHLVASGGFATVWAPPPNQGFCTPNLNVKELRLELRTDDGRLDLQLEERPFGDTVTGVGYDSNLQSIFSSTWVAAIEEPNNYQVPADWRAPERSLEQFRFEIRRQVNDQESPFCQLGESRSNDPNATCSTYDGRFLFVGKGDGPTDAGTYTETFTAALGWWTWDSP